ncbi:Riboflavin synthase alpha chain [Ceraceosorus bombacis]|uniref:Riboflavin synthase alpha chain n=1 Tax=Ceraceosorus bombacis TaxID=401625 RepID=A0A0P1BAS0_9BASI|nr:Riboflavin synthase alpha chain [Ceraceosorus bombacis]
MFTGIVELLATIVAVKEKDDGQGGGGGYSLIIAGCADILDDCHIGDSIAVNGTCLTVTAFDAERASPEAQHGASPPQKGWFKIGVAPETLKKTNLGSLKVGDRVNCERAMGAKTRFGGHFVQGHVDTTAMLVKVTPTGNALTLVLRLNNSPDLLPLPSSLSPYLIPKGYITLDGASLTLIDVSPAEGGPLSSTAGQPESQGGARPVGEVKEHVEFSVMLIAHTQDAIGLSKKKPGETVNVELDMVGKYVYRAVVGAAGSVGASTSDLAPTSEGGKAFSTSGVDAGAAALSQTQTAGRTASDALTAFIERTVRRVLSEQSSLSR